VFSKKEKERKQNKRRGKQNKKTGRKKIIHMKHLIGQLWKYGGWLHCA
jgi:hypothetical protein